MHKTQVGRSKKTYQTTLGTNVNHQLEGVCGERRIKTRWNSSALNKKMNIIEHLPTSFNCAIELNSAMYFFSEYFAGFNLIDPKH